MRYGIVKKRGQAQVIVLITDEKTLKEEGFEFKVGELVNVSETPYFLVGAGLANPGEQESPLVPYGVLAGNYRSGKHRVIHSLPELALKT